MVYTSISIDNNLHQHRHQQQPQHYSHRQQQHQPAQRHHNQQLHLQHQGISDGGHFDMGINNWQQRASHADPMSWTGMSTTTNDCDDLSEVIIFEHLYCEGILQKGNVYLF